MTGGRDHDPAPDGDPDLRETQLLLIHEIDRRILDHQYTLSETLGHVARRVLETLGANHVDILFEHMDGLRVEFSADSEEEKRIVPLDQSISGLVLARNETILVDDLEREPHLLELYYPRVHQQGQGRSILIAPIYLDDHAVGVINVESSPSAGFGQPHIGFINSIAGQISLALSHAALFDEGRLRAEVDNLVLSGTTSDSDLIPHTALQSVLDALRSFGFIEADEAEVLFVDPEDPELLVVAYSTNLTDIGVRVRVDSTVCGEAFRTNESVVLQRALENDMYQPVQEGMRCEMAMPINVGGSERFAIGVLNFESRRENAFSRVAVMLAERFARRVVSLLAFIKLRADLEGAIQDQLLTLAADQILNAIHRLNNHVGSARALASDLVEDLQDESGLPPNEVLDRLKLIVKETELGLQIPDELRRRMGSPSETSDVNGQIRAGLESLRVPKSIRVVPELSDGLPSIPCAALDLVAENLGLNAIEAMKASGGELRIRTFQTRTASQAFVVVQVEDTGVGMSRKQVATLFEPRHSPRGRGLGFGLVWVKAWVRRARGVIDVRSELGVGTTVTIRFQIEPSSGEPM
jgi:signal transduction histidine kinase